MDDFAFVFYLHADIFDFTHFDPSNIKPLKEQIQLLEVARHLKAKIYYAKSEIEKLNEDLSDDLFNTSIRNMLDLMLKDCIEHRETAHLFELFFQAEQSCLSHFKPLTIFPDQDKEEGKDKTTTTIGLSFAHNNEKKTLLHVKSKDLYDKVTLTIINNKEDLWEHINKTLPRRKYNFNPKHGDDKHKHKVIKPDDKVSQLLTNADKTQELLNAAIFDWRESKWCYNFDKQNETYIVFPYEGSLNQFHAFHITKEEWTKEIPTSIQKYFGK